MPPTRREKIRLQTHQEILDTARKQIAENGAAALSLRGIARQMGITAPALYRYFSNRDALVTELIVIAYQSLHAHLSDIRQAHREESHREQLLAIGRGYRQWGLAHPEDYALIFGTPIPGYKAPPESTLPLARSSLGVLIDVLAEGTTRGEFSIPETTPQLSDELASDPSIESNMAGIIHTALDLWGHVHGLTSLELFNHLQALMKDPDEMYEISLQNKINTIIYKEIQ